MNRREILKTVLASPFMLILPTPIKARRVGTLASPKVTPGYDYRLKSLVDSLNQKTDILKCNAIMGNR